MIWFVIGMIWCALFWVLVTFDRQAQRKNRQRQRYLKQKTMSDKVRPEWLSFYSRLETLIGAALLRRYRTYFVVACILGLFALVSQGMSLGLAIGFVLLAASITFLSVLKYFESRAISEFNQQMPDMIDSMERAVKVGAPLHDIFLTLSQQYQGSAQRLFLTMHDRLKLGHSVDKVMQFAQSQMPSREFQFLTILLSLQHETGGKLSHMLSQLGYTLRERSLMQSRVRTITSESRTSAKVLAMLPVGLVAILYSSAREHFEYLFTDDIGQWVFIYALASVASGLLLIRQLTKVNGE